VIINPRADWPNEIHSPAKQCALLVNTWQE
jgi:hypothetical protein